MYHYLSAGQLQRLKEHRYCSEGRSISEFIFQPFWNWVVTLMPLWVAPNLITILGLILNVVTSTLVILNSPQANSHDVPSYIFIFCAIGLFLYQTLDAIDGKQARRTNTSSPMGELFDHGCDAVSTIFVTVSISCALSLGSNPNYLFFFFINNSALFYVAHWQSYCSGKLSFSKIDVTEAQVEAIFGYIAAGIYGPQVFLNRVSFLPYNVSIAKSLILVVGLGALFYCLCAFAKIFRGGVGKNGTTVAQTSVLSPIVPLGIIFTCAFYVFKHSGEDLFVSHPCLFMLTFGACSAKLTCNLVIASMSKSALEMLDACMIGPCALVFYIYFGGNGILSMVGIHLPEYYLLVGILIFTIIHFVQFSVGVCIEISRDFQINVFSIPYTPEKKEN